MRNTLQFLKLFYDRIPPLLPTRHNLTLTAEGKLSLSLALEDNEGPCWQFIVLDETDLDKSPDILFEEIREQLKSVYKLNEQSPNT